MDSLQEKHNKNDVRLQVNNNGRNLAKYLNKIGVIVVATLVLTWPSVMIFNQLFLITIPIPRANPNPHRQQQK